MAERGELKKGDAVRLVKDCTDGTWASEVVAMGTTGTLGPMYRLVTLEGNPDEQELWPLWLDDADPGKKLITVTHADVEKVK